MENEIYILKIDLIKCCEKAVGVGECYFNEDFHNDVNKIIEQAPIFKEKYVHRDIIDPILDVVFEYTQHDDDEYDEIADKIETLPSVRFVNSYDKEAVYKDDVILAFKDLLDFECIAPETPEYDVIMNTIKSIPILKLEV